MTVAYCTYYICAEKEVGPHEHESKGGRITKHAKGRCDRGIHPEAHAASQPQEDAVGALATDICLTHDHGLSDLTASLAGPCDASKAIAALAADLRKSFRPTYSDNPNLSLADARFILAALPEGWTLTRAQPDEPRAVVALREALRDLIGPVTDQQSYDRYHKRRAEIEHLLADTEQAATEARQQIEREAVERLIPWLAEGHAPFPVGEGFACDLLDRPNEPFIQHASRALLRDKGEQA